MKFGVNRQSLLLIAGIVWLGAGINILRIGISTWQACPDTWLFRVGEATAVFLVFFMLVFRRLYDKHTERIENKPEQKNCPFGFFDIKGWIVMCVMISFGVVVRVFGWLPDRFISVFYTGLSLALILTGALFLRYWWKTRT